VPPRRRQTRAEILSQRNTARISTPPPIQQVSSPGSLQASQQSTQRLVQQPEQDFERAIRTLKEFIAEVERRRQRQSL
jgi:hypothetical protein